MNDQSRKLTNYEKPLWDLFGECKGLKVATSYLTLIPQDLRFFPCNYTARLLYPIMH